MCILTFLKPGVTPDLDALANGAAANPHGHGYAIVTGDTITTGRGLDPTAVLTEFATMRARHPDGPALFHSRYATHGQRTVDNCHPFPVGGDPRTILAHNGILPGNVHPYPGDDRSDTRIAAEDYLPARPFGSLDSWAGRERLERWLDTDKMVLLTVDPAYKHNAYIFNELRGVWDNGAWYSNTGYLPSPDYGTGYGYGYEFDDDCCPNCGEPVEPALLEGPGADLLATHCTWCGFCHTQGRLYPACGCRPADLSVRDLEHT